jgi:hypothetical protein
MHQGYRRILGQGADWPRKGLDSGAQSQPAEIEIQSSLRLSVSQTITSRLHYSHSDFKRNHGSEPQQNPVLVFSITLTPQKRVRPPVWIILVLHAEPA